MKNRIIKAMDSMGGFKIRVAKTTQMVEEMRKIHNTSRTATAALGRLITLASIIGADLENEQDVVTLKVKGNGPAGMLIAVSDAKGNARCTVDFPQAEVPPKSPTKLDVGSYVGSEGQLAIIMDLGLKEPFTGYADLVNGEIAEDFAHYYFQSEQIPTVIDLGVFVEPDGSVSSAGGLFIQGLPFVSDEELDQLEEIIGKLPQLSGYLKDHEPEDLLKEYFSELNPDVLDVMETEYRCNCNREKIEKALISIPKEDLKLMIQEDKGAEVICHFCNTHYHFTVEELKKLAEK